MADALEHVTSLTSLNGCGQYAAIRTGGLAEINLSRTELWMWAARFLERSAATLTTLDIRSRRRRGEKERERERPHQPTAVRIRVLIVTAGG